MTLHDDINQRGIIEHEPSFMSIFYYILFFYCGMMASFHITYGGGVFPFKTHTFLLYCLSVFVLYVRKHM